MKIVLIDDHAVVREGYRALISRQADMEVVAEYADANSAYAALKCLAVDVIVTDLSMPGLSAIEMIERLRLRDQAAKILIFSMHTAVSFAKNAFAAGANGYVTKSSEPNALLLGLREVFAGRQYLSADIAQQLALEQLAPSEQILDTLTVREFEILRLLIDGRDVENIALSLNLSPKTVRNVHYNIKKKLEVKDDIELMRRAIQLKIVNALDI